MPDNQNAEDVHSAKPNVEDQREAASVVPNRLCQTCQKLASSLVQYRDHRRHEILPEQPFKFMRYKNRQQILHTARQGCHLCTIVAADFARGYRNELHLKGIQSDLNSFAQSLATQIPFEEAEVFVTVKANDKDDVDISFLEMRHQLHELSLTAMCYLVLGTTESNGVNVSDSTTMGLPVWSGSERCLNLVGSWLRECDQIHGDCYQDAERAHQRPSRLLDLGPAGGAADVVLCDFGKDALGAGPPYVTLSYCWGGVESLKLTTENQADFLKGIEWDSIPQTFKDAITITRRLSCRYLWIDSLCINQGDPADLNRELGRMGDIYRYSVCTIAALDAENPHSGIFTIRNPLITRPITLTNASGESFRVGRYSVEVDQDQFFQHHISYPSNASPLLKRAWVFQERFLSQRIIAYTSQTISWHCSSCRVSEHYPQPMSPIFSGDTPYFLSMFTHGCKRDFNDPFGFDSRTFIHGWHGIVQEYTNLGMTHPTDRIPGITGMIDLIQRETKLDIVFGMWRNWMIEELMWVAEVPGKRLGNEAPTWSWMSSASSVRWKWLHPPLSDVTFVAEMLDVGVNHGNREDARLRIRASVEKSNSYRHGWLDPSLDVQDEEDLRPIWLLLVYFRKKSAVVSSEGAFGLLIQPTKNVQIEYDADEHTSWKPDEQTEWERVGIFHAGPEETSELWPSYTVAEGDKQVICLV